MNLFTLLEMAADAMGDRVAISHGEHDLTYAELLVAARRAAARVRAAGATRLAYLAVNGPAAPVALFGAALAGVPQDCSCARARARTLRLGDREGEGEEGGRLRCR